MKHIHCKVFGHSYKVSRNVTYHVKEYTCSNCKKQLTTNSKGNLTELTPKFKEINDVLERIHQKKNRIRLKTPQPKKGLLIFTH
jgi:transcription initiation factor IIE alpha subunit